MTGYIVRRLFALLFVLLAVSAIIFVLMNSVPGGPFDYGEHGYTPDALANIERKYGLDKPLIQRYWNYLASAAQLDFGNSYALAGNPPVTQVIAKLWPVTLQIGLYTIILAFSLGFIMGLVAAYYRNSWIDNIVTFTATLGTTLPNFVIATWLLLIFGYQIGWGQPSKWIIPPLLGQGSAILSWDYFLPVITYALGPMAIVARYTRSTVAEALSADYVRTARAKGLSERKIMIAHVLRNALIPMITVLLPLVPNLLTGSLFIEYTFGINGLGKYFILSIGQRDYPMIMGLVLLVATFWGLTYLVTDILYTVVDPRIRIMGTRSA